MSYDIELQDSVSKETINITYNYAPHFRRVFGDSDVKLSTFDNIFGGGKTGIRKLYGMTGAESINVLEQAIANLGDDTNDDYWKPTEGNAKRALIQLLSLARMRPDGIWAGD